MGPFFTGPKIIPTQPGPVETWSKLSNSERVTALELDEENDLQGSGTGNQVMKEVLGVTLLHGTFNTYPSIYFIF